MKVFINSLVRLRSLMVIFFLAGIYPVFVGDALSAAGSPDLMVLVRDGNFRTGPSLDSSLIMSLDKGTELYRKSQKKGWTSVEMPGRDISGWIHSSLLRSKKVVEPADFPDSSGRSVPEMRLGIIDVQKIIEESRKGKELRKRYRELEKDTPDDSAKVERELITEILIDVKKIVEAYSVENGFTHVINKNAGGLVYSERRFDITDAVIERYDRQFEHEKHL